MIKTKDGIDNNHPWFQFYPKGKSFSLHYPEVPLYSFLDKTAENQPNKTALVFYNQKISYQQLKELTDKFANLLKNLSIKKGDRVAFLLPNCPQFVIALYGTIKTGAIATVLNPLYSKEELHSCLQNSKPKIIVSLKMFVDKIADYPGKIIITKISDYLPQKLKILFNIKEIIKSPKEEKKNLPKRKDVFWLRKALKNSSAKLQPVQINARQDPALIIYTSGTTGVPKGAILTHFNLVSNAFSLNVWAEEIKTDSYLAVLPLFHIYGLTVQLLTAILRGASVILLPKFHTREVVKTIQKYKIQYFVGVPQMYSALVKYSASTHQLHLFDSLILCSSGAASISGYLWNKIKEIAPRAKLMEGYGLSETSPVVLIDSLSKNYFKKEGSPGIPIFDTDVRIVDMETGRELAAGEPGEIVVKGPQVFQGYWHNLEKTKQVLKNGWFYTHDIGHMDPDGRFYIHERIDDIINVKGEMVWPGRVERILKKHPKIKEAAVISVKSEYYTQAIKAYLVLKKKQTISKAEVTNFCQDKLARYEIPVFIECVEKLPRTYVGKLQRFKLRKKSRQKAKPVKHNLNKKAENSKKKKNMKK